MDPVGQAANMTVPRPEYPRPQFARPDWLCLNGTWQFEIDAGDSGYERGLHERDLTGEITVPFCPESPLSGIGNFDFMAAVWYRRTITLPEEWRGRRAALWCCRLRHDSLGKWSGDRASPWRVQPVYV
jgi:beta-galactosidase/beta-glucuronidase